MAGKTVVETQEPAPPSSNEVAQATLDALKAIAASAPPRQKRAHEVVHNTPFWDGVEPRSVLTRDFYQHGMPVKPEVLHNSTIDLINQLKTGLYNKKKWRVIAEPGGGIGLYYDTKTLGQRFEIAGASNGEGLDGILKKILTEREAQDIRAKKTGSRYEDE